MPRRAYTEEEKAAALAALVANGGNLARTAQQVGIPRKTLAEWAAKQSAAGPPPGGEPSPLSSPPKKAAGRPPSPPLVPAVAPAVLAEAQADLAGKFDGVAHRALDLTPEKLADSSASQLVVIAGVAVDKMRLLRGESTSNEHVAVDLAAFRSLPRDEQLRLYREALQARR